MARNSRAAGFLMGRLRGRLSPRPRVDRVQRAMDRAPIDDEPLTEEEERSLDAIEAERGPRYTLAEARKLLGIS